MVIAKILPAKSNNFNGVGYNENKQENEKATLLEANNFVGLDINNSSQKDYVMYLQNQTKKNTRIKKPQFHATISSKGKEKSFEELQDFAKEWMKQMGYGDNPYLVYGHKDTENNHLHIVTTRIDNEGIKINDSKERYRSQEIINEYYGLNYEKEVEKAIKNINSYNIQTLSQYKLLIERDFKIKESEKQFIIYKSNYQKPINKSRVEEIIKEKKKFYKFDKIKDRKEEIRNIIISLNKQVELKNIPIIAKEHNLDVTFFYKKDKPEEIYGYSVIDNKSKTVFKGSDIISLKNLKELEKKVEKENEIKMIISSYFKHTPANLKDLNNFLRETEKIEVDFNGNIYTIDEENRERANKLTIKLDKDFMNRFFYKTRLDFANNFTVLLKEDKQILSHLFKVNKNDLNYFKGTEKERVKELEKRAQLNDYYNSTLKFISSDKEQAKDLLEQTKIEIYKIGESFFVADMETNNILHFDIDDGIKQTVLEQGLYTELQSQSIEQVVEQEQSLLESIANALDEGFEDETNNKRKKKRQQNKQRGM